MSFFDQRMPQKQQRAYETLCKTLKDQGIDTSIEAQQSLLAVNHRALSFTIFLILVGGVLLILFPSAKEITLVFIFIGLLGILSGAMRSKKMIARYLSELRDQGR